MRVWWAVFGAEVLAVWVGVEVSDDKRSLFSASASSAARVYDYLLGGRDNSAADRNVAERIIAAYPEARTLARANRRFLTRAVWFMAEQGIRQYIDLGTGLPTSPNVHEIARQIRPDARIAYVDNDSDVTKHSKMMCGTAEGVIAIKGDIRYPDEILDNPELAALIDLSEPVAILCVSVLHFIRDEENPKEIMAALRFRISPGSYLVVSHMAREGADEGVIGETSDVYLHATAPALPRTELEIRGLLSGLDLIEPGLVDVSLWRPDMRVRPTRMRILAAVGRKRDSGYDRFLFQLS